VELLGPVVPGLPVPRFAPEADRGGEGAGKAVELRLQRESIEGK